MNESQFTSNISKKFPPDIYSWKINDNYQGGVPDACYLRNDGKLGTIVFNEVKYLKSLPAKDTTIIKPKLSVQQHLWLDMLTKMGVHALVTIGYGSKGVILDYTNDQIGISKRDFVSKLMTYQEMADYISGLVKSEKTIAQAA